VADGDGLYTHSLVFPFDDTSEMSAELASIDVAQAATYINTDAELDPDLRFSLHNIRGGRFNLFSEVGKHYNESHV